MTVGKVADPYSRGYMEHPLCERDFLRKISLGRMALDLTSTALGPEHQQRLHHRAARWVSVSFSEQYSSAMPSVLMPAGPCQLPGEWLPNFNDSWFPTASKQSATSLAARDVQTHRCQDKGWPKQASPSCSLSESKSPVNLVSQTCQLLARELEKQLAFSIPWMAGNFQFHRTSACPQLTCIWLSSYRSHPGLQKPCRSLAIVPSIGKVKPPTFCSVAPVFIGSDSVVPAWHTFRSCHSLVL